MASDGGGKDNEEEERKALALSSTTAVLPIQHGECKLADSEVLVLVLLPPTGQKFGIAFQKDATKAQMEEWVHTHYCSKFSRIRLAVFGAAGDTFNTAEQVDSAAGHKLVVQVPRSEAALTPVGTSA